MKLSAAITAKNSQDTLEMCIDSAKNITDDIFILIDSSSSDDTEEICKKKNVRYSKREFTDFSSQKNIAAENCLNDWVFSIDSDEVIELKENVGLIIEKIDPKTALSIKRINKIFGKNIKYTNWDPNPIVRIYNKKYCRYDGKVHENIVGYEKTKEIKGNIFHYNYKNVEQFLKKMNMYTSMSAQSDPQFSASTMFFLPLYEFLRRYVIHAGFLDGTHGLFLSMLMSIYVTVEQVKKWEKYQKRY